VAEPGQDAQAKGRGYQQRRSARSRWRGAREHARVPFHTGLGAFLCARI